MKNRTRKQLLQIVIDSLKKGDKNGWTNNGICGEIYDLYNYDELSPKEREVLINLIEKYKPTRRNQFKSFTENAHFTASFSSWWWTKMQDSEAGREQRILFLQKIIEVI